MKRILSLILTAVMLTTLLPAAAFAAEEPSFEESGAVRVTLGEGAGGEGAAQAGAVIPEGAVALQDADERSGVNSMHITNAGASQLNGWETAIYEQRMEELASIPGIDPHSQMHKAQIMFRTCALDVNDYELPVAWYFLASDEPTDHLLTLYSWKRHNVDDFTISADGDFGWYHFTETVYGDGEGELYAYSIGIVVAPEDVTVSIDVWDEETQTTVNVGTFPFIHIRGGGARTPRVTGIDVMDYESYYHEGTEYLAHFSLRLSGFFLPDDVNAYKLWIWDSAKEDYDTSLAQVVSISEPDEYGRITLKFAFEMVPAHDLIWLDLYINGEPAYFFGREEHIDEDPETHVLSFNDYAGGGNVSISSPFSAINGGVTYGAPEPGVAFPRVIVPNFSTEPEITVSVTPGDYAAGEIAYSTDGGESYSAWLPMASSVTVPLGSETGTYSLVFRARADGVEDWTSPEYPVFIEVPLPEPEVLPSVDLPAETTEGSVTAAVAPGSYEGGELSYGVNGVWSEWQEVTASVPIALSEGYGEYEIAFMFRKDGIKETSLPSLCVSYSGPVIERYVRTLYAPAVASFLTDSGFVTTPGATISGAFEATGEAGFAQRATLSYVDGTLTQRSFTVPAAPKDASTFEVYLTVPADAASLTSLSYELIGPEGALDSHVTYDLSGYAVVGETVVDGFPEDYVGTTFRLKGAAERYAVISADNLSGVSLGDLPTGSYTWEISGASGYIAAGGISIERGSSFTLEGLPGLCSLTANADQDIAGSVRVDYTAPDGTAHTAHGALGTAMTQLPKGSTASVSMSYDTAAYPDYLGASEGSISVTLDADKEVAFTMLPLSFRTISGTLVDSTGSRRAGYKTITLEQMVSRGGKTETYRATGRSDYNGKFSIRAYDGIPATLTVNALSFDKTSCTVTDNGDVEGVEITLTFNQDYVVRVELVVNTPEAVDENLSHYVDEEGNSGVDSAFVRGDASLLNLGRVYVSGRSKSLVQGEEYDVITAGGEMLLKFHAGVVPAGAGISATFYYPYGQSWYEYGNGRISINTGPGVTLDEKGNAVLRVDGYRYGGELRCTVVEEEDEDYVGFLALGTEFVYGRGELCLPYENAVNGVLVKTFKCRTEELEDFLSFLSSWSGGMTDEYCHSKWMKTLPNSRYVYLTDPAWKTKTPVGSKVLGAYKLHTQIALSSTPGSVIVTGVLEKRYPDAPDADNIYSAQILVPNGFMMSRSVPCIFNGETIPEGGTYLNDRQWGDGPVAETPVNTFTVELPLDANNRLNATLAIRTYTLSRIDAQGRYSYSMLYKPMELNDEVCLFDVGVPDTVSIADQLDAQGLYGGINVNDPRRATWTLALDVRSFVSENEDENEITIYDNGTVIDTFVLDRTFTTRRVRITDNLNPGVHVISATRTYDGEVMSTQPKAFSLIRGTNESQDVYISNITWQHWNHWDPSADHQDIYLKTLADLSGREIWIWPEKKSNIYFKVNNASLEEIDGITLDVSQQWDKLDAMTRARLGTHKRFDAVCTLSDPVTRTSFWKIEDAYLGYAVALDFQYHYKEGVIYDGDPTEEQRRQAELKALYEANGLGSVPDDLARISQINAATSDEIKTAMAEGAAEGLPAELKNLTLNVASQSDSAITFTASSADVPSFTLSMSEGETIADPNDIWLLMEKEQAEGSQDPNEPASEGWEVAWSQMDTLQGTTIIRMATLNEQLPDGRWHTVSHRRVYLPEQVAAALSGGAALSADEGAELMELRNDFTERADRGKKVYDVTNDIYTYTDLANTFYVNRMEKEMTNFMGSAEAGKKFGKECSLISDRAGTAMNILGVANTAYQIYKGPSGQDGTGLRELLSHVKDERFRKGIEWQIRDYEKLRQDIYVQDTTMNTINSAASFAEVTVWTKVATFLGGLGYNYFSDGAKEYNQQVYNSTLLDIQRQLRFERNKESKKEAEQWLRNKMDSIYGKGNWSEYALEEERKYWVLVEDEYGNFHYVWHEKAYFKVVWDPSGYVFEATPENRLDGVTATLYFSESENGDYSVWNFTDGKQQNPVTTANNGTDGGRYSWMVPEGWWKVRYDCDGYQTAWSKPMHVLPIHTAVNIGLLSTTAPKAKIAASGSSITVAFDQYMQLESLVRLPQISDKSGDAFYADTNSADYSDYSFDASFFGIRFTDASGRVIPGTVTFPDRVRNTGYTGGGYGTDVIASQYFARTAVFTPALGHSIEGFTAELTDGMVSYSGVALDKTPAAITTVTLDPAGGVLSGTLLIAGADGKVAKLPQPLKEDDTFLGWFTARSGGTEVTADTAFTTDTTVYAHWANADPTEDYVERAYEIILGRSEKDIEGIAHWTNELNAGASAGEIIKEFFRSDEYKARGLTNAETVSLCYQAMLSRAPDATGLANWTALLDDGYSTTKLVSEFVSSPEFAAICADYGLTAGSIALDARDRNSNITRFVQRCYSFALSREADEDGLNEWCEHLLVQDLTPERVAFGFVFSDEAKGRGLSDSAFIDMLYRMMLDRAPDAAGLENWLGALAAITQAEIDWAHASGERTEAEARDQARQNVYATFAASAEFALMCANYGF